MHRTLLLIALLISTQSFAQLYLVNEDQKVFKKVKEGTVISLRLSEMGSFNLHGLPIDSTDQVELKGILGKTGPDMITLRFVSARSYYKKGSLVGSHALLFDGLVTEDALELKIKPNDVAVLTLERDRSRNTALLLRSLGLLTFFAAPLVSLNFNNKEVIHSDTYLWVAGAGITITIIGAIMKHISNPKTFLLKEVPFPETKHYKRARLSLN